MMRDYAVQFWIEDKIRKVFKMTKKPSVATWESWEAFDNESKESSKVGTFLITLSDNTCDFLHIAGEVVRLVPIRRFIRNYRDKTHVLHMSKTKVGQCTDISNRIPDAIFTTLIWFVEHECVQMQQWCEKSKNIEKLVKKNPTMRETIGVEWLEWQRENATEECKQNYDKLIAAYHYAKYEWGKADPYLLYTLEGTAEEKRIICDKIRQMEERLHEEETMHLTNVVQLRNHLWT
jgi:hypothetical protein